MPPVRDEMLLLSSICGKHFDDDCYSCRTAKESNDYRVTASQVEAGEVERLRALLSEAQLLFAFGVGAMTENGDKDNQERCIRDAGELNLRISAALAAQSHGEQL